MGHLKVVRRVILLSNPGRYGVPDEQLHLPFLWESANGIWYMTYREGPDAVPGHRVQCVQSRDQGNSWIPWMGLEAQPWLYQFFVNEMADGSLLFYRTKMAELHPGADGTSEATAILFRSLDRGATWQPETTCVTGLPYRDASPLVTLWGHIVKMPADRLLWGVITREGNSLAGVVESTDGGRSWRFLASLCDDPSVGERREPGIVRLASGDLLAVLRTGLPPDSPMPMVQTRSTDGGRTWGAPRKLAAPGACPQLLVLDNGVLICSYGTRTDKHVMAGWDGTGETWSEPMLLYEGQGSGYCQVRVLGPDRFRITYDESSWLAYQEGGNRLVRVEMTATA